MKILFAVASAAAITLAWGTPALAGKTSPDDGVYALYNVDPNDHSVDLEICRSGGCAFGFFDAFDRPCAVLESVPKIKKTVMTRDIYVLDKRAKATDPVTLSVYHRIDDASGGSDNVTVTLTKKIALDITAGAKANCKMVETPSSVYLGTDRGAHAVAIDKKTLTANDFAPGPTTLLDVDSRGYVTASNSDAGGFMLYDPTGAPLLSGGGTPHEAGDQTATVFN